MTYSALLEAYGWERFAERRRARRRDLADRGRPPRRSPARTLRRVQLVAPTSSDERIALAAERTDGWLYLVTLTGTTGARSGAVAGARAARRADAPADATSRSTPGFGISTPAHAAAAAELADGVVVGSAALRRGGGAGALERFVASLRAAIS